MNRTDFADLTHFSQPYYRNVYLDMEDSLSISEHSYPKNSPAEIQSRGGNVSNGWYDALKCNVKINKHYGKPKLSKKERSKLLKNK